MTANATCAAQLRVLAHPLPLTARARLSVSLLGWGSAISGAALVSAPRFMTRVYGLPRVALIGRVLGLRDVVIGLGLLRHAATSSWLFARGAADALDAVLIGASFRNRGLVITAGRTFVAIGLSAVAFATGRHVTRRGSLLV